MKMIYGSIIRIRMDKENKPSPGKTGMVSRFVRMSL
jgi:hypothetical protein